MDFFAIVLLGFVAFTLSAIVLCIRWRLKSTWAMTLGSVLIWLGVLVFAFGPRIETTGQSYDDNGVVNSSFRSVGPHLRVTTCWAVVVYCISAVCCFLQPPHR